LFAVLEITIVAVIDSKYLISYTVYQKFKIPLLCKLKNLFLLFNE